MNHMDRWLSVALSAFIACIIGCAKPADRVPEQTIQQMPDRKPFFTAECVGVTDGDTIIVMHDGEPEKVRLHGVDCPETGQSFATKAKGLSSSMVLGKIVEVHVKGVDKDGRTVGTVVLDDGTNLNHELLKAGLAWWYKQYAPDAALLGRLEKQARKSNVGLWSDPDPVAPWQHRRLQAESGQGPNVAED